MNGRSKSNTAAVCQEHELCALSAFRFPDAGPPLSGARVPLKKLLIHWIRPLSLNSVRKAHQALRQRPRPSERCNCRRQVLGLGYCLGGACHMAPVRKTQRMSSRTFRVYPHRRPRLRGLTRSGSIFRRCRSVSNLCRPIGLCSYEFWTAGNCRILSSGF